MAEDYTTSMSAAECRQVRLRHVALLREMNTMAELPGLAPEELGYWDIRVKGALANVRLWDRAIAAAEEREAANPAPLQPLRLSVKGSGSVE